MDGYPANYVAHNLPLIFLSGLEHSQDFQLPSYPLLYDNGYHLKVDLAVVGTPASSKLLQMLLDSDARNGPWNSRSETGKPGGFGFKLQSIGRSLILPPRKASPPSVSPPLSPGLKNARGSPPPMPVLHSPISPLTPKSPTYPDAVMTPLWVMKHDDLLPSALVLFCPVTSDRNTSSLKDNHLKNEINAFKSSLEATKYKTRLVIVLMSDGSDSVKDSEERISSIRRATNMDSKNSFFYLPAEPLESELQEFVKVLFATLQPSCVEYYRDLSKHARKKRNRSSTPPPTAPPTSGTSQVLSVQGWNTRYEFKLGIFAEFRQEMDAACRNYESAYEGLLGQDVFETIAGWSPRFDDTRMIADAIAARIIRCLLWTAQFSTAVRWWSSHRSRMQDLIDRRGKGTNNYGWQAWESRWSQVMAEIVTRVDPAALKSIENADVQTRRAGAIYALPEKAFPIGERLPPWNLLHHPGYWYYRAAKYTLTRLQMAKNIPEEDRFAPGQSPASHIANKSYLYDTYLVPEPHVERPLPNNQGFDHLGLANDMFKKSIKEFVNRNQIRQSIYLRLQLAKNLMTDRLFGEAHEYLWPIWKRLPWRQAGWWSLIQEFDLLLRECAMRVNHAESVIQVNWELLNRVFPPMTNRIYDLSKSLTGMDIGSPRPAVVLKCGEIVSCVAASFSFYKFDGNVGESLQSQLIVTSNAQPNSTPIVLSEVKVVFEGGLRPIWLTHEPSAQSPRSRIMNVSLRDAVHSTDLSSPASPTTGMVSLVGKCDLSMCPGESRAYTLTSIPREAGDVRLDSVTLLLEEEDFSLAYVVPGQECEGGMWASDSKERLRLREFGFDRNVATARIQPKPPKLLIETPNLRETYYTDEELDLALNVVNHEDETTSVQIEVRLLGGGDSPAHIAWGVSGEKTDDTFSKETTQDGTSYLAKRDIGEIKSAGTYTQALLISHTAYPFDYELEITATYHLISDPETPIIKTTVVDVSFIRPFESQCDFLPRYHPDRWPSFFHIADDYDTQKHKPRGIPQRYCLNAKVIPLAQESLILDGVRPIVFTTNGDIACDIHPLLSPFLTQALPPDHFGEFNFDFDVQKYHLEDRRPATINLTLTIKWHRPSTPDQCNVSTIPIPRFVIPYEPRVIATVIQDTPSLNDGSMIRKAGVPGVLHMDYTIENPSMHTLPFALNMEASEEFAFSGPKAKTLHLLPYTRKSVRYNLLSAKTGVWIKPKLEVVDKYFNTKVKVFPGTRGMKRDRRIGREEERGLIVYVEGENMKKDGDAVEAEEGNWLVGRRL